jgi:hypothetical protein
MNANELADELENTYPFVGVMEIAATMLRQQQSEIEALKAENSHLKYEISSGAWNPAELTDAETALKSLYEALIRYENLSLFPDKYAIESCEYQLHDAKEKARAILRKAQEK